MCCVPQTVWVCIYRKPWPPDRFAIIRLHTGRATGMRELDKLNQLSESHGALQPGHGMVSGVIALSLAILCFLGVLAFHFPEYLTTPELRRSYNVDMIRKLMLGALAVAGGISLVNIVFNRARWLSAFAFVLVAL